MPGKKAQCPTCFSELKLREVAPCQQCGHFEHELKDCRLGRHTYARYQLFNCIELNLCDFCYVDMSSVCLAKGYHIDVARIDVIRKLPSELTKALVCEDCNVQPAFAAFQIFLEQNVANDATGRFSQYFRRTLRK